MLNKVLKEDRDKVKASLRKIFYASTPLHAKEAVEMFKRDWGKGYPSAVERSFREVRGRTKGIGRFKDEERALTMVYWQIKELRWHGVDMTAEARAILAKIKAEKLGRIAA